MELRLEELLAEGLQAEEQLLAADLLLEEIIKKSIV